MNNHSTGDIPLFDAHNDTLILREVRGDPIDFSVVDEAYDVDLPRMRSGNLMAMFVMVGDNNLVQSVRLIDAVRRMNQRYPDDFAHCCTQTDVCAAREAGRIALVMSIEGQAMFAEDTALLRQWYRLGVRVAGLTHGEGKFGGPPSALQYDRSCAQMIAPAQRARLRRREKGLTPFARESLEEMARLGMVLDLAHANDATFWEAIENYPGPVCCTHGNCYRLCPQGRNLTDDMLKALAERNGVLGLCFYSRFIDADTPTLDRFVDHVEHALGILGDNGVAIGSDFDGVSPEQTLLFDDVSRMPDFWDAVAKRIPANCLDKIGWKNLLRLLPE